MTRVSIKNQKTCSPFSTSLSFQPKNSIKSNAGGNFQTNITSKNKTQSAIDGSFHGAWVGIAQKSKIFFIRFFLILFL